MKKTLLIFLSFLLSSSSLFAQSLADGYYRVRNAATDRYLYLNDDKGSAELVGANPVCDLDAIILRKDHDLTISDPGTIIYVANHSGNEYNFSAQGTSIYKILSRYVVVRPVGSNYAVGATQSGVTKYLADKDPFKGYTYGIIDIDGDNRQWEAIPLKAQGEEYFGLNPNVKVDSKQYASFFADFGFKTFSEGLKVYYASKVNEEKGLVCMKELTGEVPNSTPIFVECSSSEPSKNRLELVNNKSQIKDNILKGNIFDSSNQFLKEGYVPEAPAGQEKFYKYGVKLHENRTKYDAKTMRVLGVSPDGKLAFVKDPDLEYLPANQSYLVVSENAPEYLLVVPESEYETLSIETLTTENTNKEIYDLLGKKVSSARTLSAGIYIINGKKTVIR